jgi:hypothetical protein
MMKKRMTFPDNAKDLVVQGALRSPLNEEFISSNPRYSIGVITRRQYDSSLKRTFPRNNPELLIDFEEVESAEYITVVEWSVIKSQKLSKNSPGHEGDKKSDQPRSRYFHRSLMPCFVDRIVVSEEDPGLNRITLWTKSHERGEATHSSGEKANFGHIRYLLLGKASFIRTLQCPSPQCPL